MMRVNMFGCPIDMGNLPDKPKKKKRKRAKALSAPQKDKMMRRDGGTDVRVK